ncbi:MAG: aryl-sulfate sulfotransferase [Bacteroidales bacterium]|nr:aryl-sulfate sulfotransferase [Bacteroidales bacterium]MCF8458325.1 aryl-sulfate sulfotransferase [Bacteroidales bacterium]
MKNVKFLFVLSLLSVSSHVFAQQTIGLFLNTEESYNGYTLFAPMRNTSTFLIDNCGELVHSWASTRRPTFTAYLREDGTLIRAGRTINLNFSEAGGAGGMVEMIDWNGALIWNYTISTPTECQHHDIEYLPNGNVLILSWDSKTAAQAAQAGRAVSDSVLWSEKIIEVEPDFVNGGGTIVWEWKAWDHLVQDFDSLRSNYGNVAASPQLININFYNNDPLNIDWLHINSVEYNEKFDQIMLCVHAFSEIWIIDHSTTYEESATHSGGNYNKGGDLLYRWGNPQAYDQGSASDQLLFLPHNSYWIEDSLTDGGMIMVFNNKASDPIEASAVNIIDPPVDINGNYSYSGTAYAPSTFHWTYQAPVPTDFYSANLSSAQRLANGNTLICEGRIGHFFEIDPNGDMVWEYVNPVNGQGPMTQGDSVAQTQTYKCHRYSPDYPALSGQTLTPQGYIETGSTFPCIIYTGINEEGSDMDITLYPNPASEVLTIRFDGLYENIPIEIYSITGQLVYTEQMDTYKNIELDISTLNEGIYIIYFRTENRVYVRKLVIQ